MTGAAASGEEAVRAVVGVGRVIAPDPKAAAEKARRCAMEAGDIKLANAYFMLADTLRELEDERAETTRLRAELAAR